MDINAIRATLNTIISLRDEVDGLTGPVSYGYTLGDYADQAREQISFTNHGERDRFFVPSYDAIMKLQEWPNIEPSKFRTAFTTHKRKLLTILNQYIKGIQKGLADHLHETSSLS